LRGSHVVAALVIAAARDAAAQQHVVWRYAADTDITYFNQSPIGTVLVAAGRSLTSIDPASGKTTWSLSDSTPFATKRLQAIPFAPYLWVIDDGGSGLIDLESGAWKWRAPSPTLANSRGRLIVPEKQLMLDYVEADESHRILRAVDIETGNVKWQLDTVFTRSPDLIEVQCCAGRKIKTIEGSLPPFFDGDSTLVVWLTEDGPLAVNVNSGAVLWRAKSLEGKRPPDTRGGYARTLAANGVVYLPYEKSLTALNIRDGNTVWEKPRDYRSHVAQMQLLTDGLLVRAQVGPKDGGFVHRNTLDLLDPETGKSRWKDAFDDMAQSTSFVVRNDTAFVSVDAHSFVGTHQKLMAIALATGASREVASFQFKGDEHPVSIQSRPAGLALTSSQNVMMIDSAGLVRYHTYFPAPQASTLARLGIAALVLAADIAAYSLAGGAAQATRSAMPYPVFNPLIDTRYKASVAMERYMYLRTTVPDSTGEDVQGFVRIDKDTGKDNGRAAVGVKTGYVIDEVDGRVYFLAKPRDVVALRF
jgi:outer membrane protein assembly factor BamB